MYTGTCVVLSIQNSYSEHWVQPKKCIVMATMIAEMIDMGTAIRAGAPPLGNVDGHVWTWQPAGIKLLPRSPRKGSAVPTQQDSCTCVCTYCNKMHYNLFHVYYTNLRKRLCKVLTCIYQRLGCTWGQCIVSKSIQSMHHMVLTTCKWYCSQLQLYTVHESLPPERLDCRWDQNSLLQSRLRKEHFQHSIESLVHEVHNIQ